MKWYYWLIILIIVLLVGGIIVNNNNKKKALAMGLPAPSNVFNPFELTQITRNNAS